MRLRATSAPMHIRRPRVIYDDVRCRLYRSFEFTIHVCSLDCCDSKSCHSKRRTSAKSDVITSYSKSSTRFDSTCARRKGESIRCAVSLHTVAVRSRAATHRRAGPFVDRVARRCSFVAQAIIVSHLDLSNVSVSEGAEQGSTISRGACDRTQSVFRRRLAYVCECGSVIRLCVVWRVSSPVAARTAWDLDESVRRHSLILLFVVVVVVVVVVLVGCGH
jgi:hypothetical protein